MSVATLLVNIDLTKSKCGRPAVDAWLCFGQFGTHPADALELACLVAADATVRCQATVCANLLHRAPRPRRRLFMGRRPMPRREDVRKGMLLHGAACPADLMPPAKAEARSRIKKGMFLTSTPRPSNLSREFPEFESVLAHAGPVPSGTGETLGAPGRA
jgi:hypothetical protein